MSFGFGATDGKISIFKHNQPWKSTKTWLESKSFGSMTSQKVQFLRPNNLGLQKKFWPKKHQKLMFSKNPNSLICPNIGGGFHRGLGDHCGI